jgi:hypothetical protein
MIFTNEASLRSSTNLAAVVGSNDSQIVVLAGSCEVEVSDRKDDMPHYKSSFFEVFG